MPATRAKTPTATCAATTTVTIAELVVRIVRVQIRGARVVNDAEKHASRVYGEEDELHGECVTRAGEREHHGGRQRKHPPEHHQSDVPVDGGLVVRMGKIRGRILVLGQGLVGVRHLHAAHATVPVPISVAVAVTMTIAVCKGGRDESQDRSARNDG